MYVCVYIYIYMCVLVPGPLGGPERGDSPAEMTGVCQVLGECEESPERRQSCRND